MNRLWHVIFISKNPLHLNPTFLWVDVRRYVGSYTPPVTDPSLWYHHHSIQPSSLRSSPLPHPLYLHFHRHSSYAVVISSHHRYTHASSASHIGLPLRFLPLPVPLSLIHSCLILSSFVTSHIRRSSLFYCAFCNVPALILPLSCTTSPRIFTFMLECVHANSVNMFKNKIDKYLVKAGS